MSETMTETVQEPVPDPVSEPIPEHRPVSPRARSLFDSALTTGSLATITTCGALIGLGRRDDDMSRVFRLAGRGLLERVGIASSSVPLTAVGVGYLHHLLVASLWGFGLSLLVLPRRGVTRIVTAVTVAALYAWLSADFVPAALRIGYSVTSNVHGAVSIGISLAVALLGGIWLSTADREG